MEKEDEESSAIAYKRFEIMQRKTRVQEVCAKWRAMGYDKNSPVTNQTTRIMKVDEEHRLSGCLIPKVVTGF